MFQLLFIFILFLSSLFYSKTYCEEFKYFPAIGAINKSLSYPADSKNINTHFSLGLFSANYHDIYGVGIASLYQESFGDVYGLQFASVNYAHHIQYGIQSAFVNFAHDYHYGIQFALFYNKLEDGNFTGQIGLVNSAKNINGAQFGLAVSLANRLNGIQTGLLVNKIDTIQGIQLAMVNLADSVNGLQVGFVNKTSSINGIQLGIVNYADNEEGTSIGVLSFVRNGTFRISNQYSSQHNPSIQTELGGKTVYNIIRYTYSADDKRFEYWIGFGAKVTLFAEKFYFYPQIFMAGYLAPQTGYGLTSKFGYLHSEDLEFISGLNFIFNKNAFNNRIGFLHDDKYNAEFFLGVQFNFKQTIFQSLFKE